MTEIADIDQILDRVDLVEMIGRRVQLKKSGKSYTACCPFHGEKTPSFHVHRDKGFYHCFGSVHTCNCSYYKSSRSSYVLFVESK